MVLMFNAIGDLFNTLFNLTPSHAHAPTVATTIYSDNTQSVIQVRASNPSIAETLYNNGQGRVEAPRYKPRTVLQEELDKMTNAHAVAVTVASEHAEMLEWMNDEYRKVRATLLHNELDWDVVEDTLNKKIKTLQYFMDAQRMRAAHAEGRANWMDIETRRANKAEQKVTHLERVVTHMQESAHRSMHNMHALLKEESAKVKKAVEKNCDLTRRMNGVEITAEEDKVHMYKMLQRSEEKHTKVMEKNCDLRRLIAGLEITAEEEKVHMYKMLQRAEEKRANAMEKNCDLTRRMNGVEITAEEDKVHMYTMLQRAEEKHAKLVRKYEESQRLVFILQEQANAHSPAKVQDSP